MNAPRLSRVATKSFSCAVARCPGAGLGIEISSFIAWLGLCMLSSAFPVVLVQYEQAFSDHSVLRRKLQHQKGANGCLNHHERPFLATASAQSWMNNRALTATGTVLPVTEHSASCTAQGTCHSDLKGCLEQSSIKQCSDTWSSGINSDALRTHRRNLPPLPRPLLFRCQPLHSPSGAKLVQPGTLEGTLQGKRPPKLSRVDPLGLYAYG